MTDLPAADSALFLRNLYACGTACSRLAAQLLLRVASSGESTLLDMLLQIADEVRKRERTQMRVCLRSVLNLCSKCVSVLCVCLW